MSTIISFPHLADYHIPIKLLLENIFTDAKVMTAPKTTKRTLELGSKYSPDFICVPFKYNLGNFIESLEQGANVLIQAGGGCRYGYYAEIQEQILHDLGYEFEFVRLLRDRVDVFTLYRTCRRMGSKISFHKFIYNVLLTLKMVQYMDSLDVYVRENIGFEKLLGSFEGVRKNLFKELERVTSFTHLDYIYKRFKNEFEGIRLIKKPNCLKVGIVGELYTLMEPFSNFFIERELAKYNISVSRFINITFLLFEKSKLAKQILKECGDYLKYPIGADGTDSVAKGKTLAENNYDGLIHIKPFGCTPEINAMPMLQNIGKDYKIPVLFFSFDSQTSETGVKTRLEAFYDMLSQRKGI